MKKYLLFLLFIASIFQYSFSQFSCRIDTTNIYRYYQETDSLFAIQREINTYNASDLITDKTTQEWNVNQSGQWSNFTRRTTVYDGNNNITEITDYNYNTSTNTWDASYREINEYNANNLKISRETQYGPNFQPDQKEINTYDSNGFRTELLTQTYFNGQFLNSFKVIFTNNSAGLPTEELSQQYNNNAWETISRLLKSYNSAGKITERIAQEYDLSNWVNNNKYTYFYNANNFYTGFEEQYWSNSQWVNNTKLVITVDNAGNELVNLRQVWDFNTNNWVDDYRETRTFNNANLQLTYIYETFTSGGWIPSQRTTNTYNSNNLRISFLRETYNTFNSVWSNNFRETWEYDQYGNVIARELNNSWDNNSQYFAFRLRYENKCTLLETVSINDLTKKLDAKIYPNPVKNILSIEFETPQAIAIYNLTGNQMLSIHAQETYTIDVSHFSAGIYFIKTAKGVSKFVKE